MEIYLMRHGETEWNRQRRLQGHSDIPLNDVGLAEARKASRAMRSIDFDCILSSPLQRAVKTAELVRGDRSYQVQINPLLTEITFGAAEGIYLSEDRISENDPELTAEVLHFLESPQKYGPPRGGESIGEAKARAGRFLTEILLPREQDCSRILVVAHGGIIRAMLDIIECFPDSEFWSGKLLRNCGSAVISLENQHFSFCGTRDFLGTETRP